MDKVFWGLDIWEGIILGSNLFTFFAKTILFYSEKWFGLRLPGYNSPSDLWPSLEKYFFFAVRSSGI